MENQNQTKTLGSYFNGLQNQNQDETAGNKNAVWSESLHYYMLTTYLTQYFGDITMVNKAELPKFGEAIVSLQLICGPIVRSLITRYSKEASTQITAWSYQRFYFMLITHLTQRFGDITRVNKTDVVKACKAIATAQFTSAPIVDNVINLFSSRALALDTSLVGVGEEEAA